MTSNLNTQEADVCLHVLSDLLKLRGCAAVHRFMQTCLSRPSSWHCSASALSIGPISE